MMDLDGAVSPAHAEATARPSLPRRILVGIDRSEPSLAALRYADRLAESFGADVLAVNAWVSPTSYMGLVDGPADLRERAEARLEDSITTAFAGTPPARVTAQVIEGDAATALITTSEDADLLVVGSRGHGGFVGLLLGSVSSQCTEYARCPVLIYHAKQG